MLNNTRGYPQFRAGFRFRVSVPARTHPTFRAFVTVHLRIDQAAPPPGSEHENYRFWGRRAIPLDQPPCITRLVGQSASIILVQESTTKIACTIAQYAPSLHPKNIGMWHSELSLNNVFYRLLSQTLHRSLSPIHSFRLATSHRVTHSPWAGTLESDINR